MASLIMMVMMIINLHRWMITSMMIKFKTIMIMTEIFPPAAHLHVSPCPLTGNFALRATATHRWQSGPAGSGGVSRPLQDPSPKAKLASELANAEEGHLLEADEGHLGDLAMMANGSCSTLSTLKSACAHSHQMAIAPCGRGFLSFLILNSYITSLPLHHHYHHHHGLLQELLCFHVTTGGQRKAPASRNHSQLCLTNPKVQGEFSIFQRAYQRRNLSIFPVPNVVL